MRATETTKLTGEVRVYLLDGSGSMLSDGQGSARARVRDSILVAELATMLERLSDMRHERVVLFYRYFTREVGELHRVSSRDEALQAVDHVLGRVRTGGTDIERALVTSFETIREAHAGDPVLGRAQIVLITDGQADVREELIQSEREKTGEIPIAVSVIALGEQNDALRAMVARQRRRGERAFYHYSDDASLADICKREPPERVAIETPASQIKEELGKLIDEMTELDSERQQALRRTAILDEPTDELARAYAELGLSRVGEAELARGECVARDRQAIRARFDRWFPAAASDRPCFAGQEEIAAMVVLLTTIAEVAREVGATELERRVDAIEILERLLPDARMTPLRYRMLVASPIPDVAEGLAAVHESVS